MMIIQKFFPTPAGYFGMPLGLMALALAFRYGASKGFLDPLLAESIGLFAALLWVLLILGFALKWIKAREAALAEVNHPILCCFISLIPITTIMMGSFLLPYSHTFAWVFWSVGIVGQIVFAAWRSGGLWRGTHSEEATSPVLYLPGVAANFVSASAMALAGQKELAYMFFGIGVLAWLTTESALLQRLRTKAPLPLPVRPSMGIILAPPFVGGAAYLSINGGAIDIIVISMIGYGMVQFLNLTRLLPFIFEGGFTPSAWAFSFGLASMVAVGFRLMDPSQTVMMETLGMVLVLIGSLVIAFIFLKTLLFFFTAAKN